MRIISKFKDFYDGVQGTFQDTDMLWKRLSPFAKDGAPEEPIMGLDEQPCEILRGVPLDNEWENHWANYWGFHTRWYILGFCGQIHILLQDEGDEEDRRFMYYEPKPDKLVWSFDDWMACRAAFLKKRKIHHKYLRGKRAKKYEREAAEFFNQTPLPELQDIFHKYQTPLFLIRRARYSYPDVPNPCALFVNTVSLEGLGWQKRMDAFTTYQEIMMFLGGMAHPEPHMLQVEDKDQIVKKGFDLRTSFRHPVK